MLGLRARFLRQGRERGIALLGVLLCLAAATAAGAPRLVAVGDVHGDLAAFRAILAEAGLVDVRGSWTGGDATLVQVGDLIDRGPNMRGTLDFVIALEKEAPARGGKVVPLLGNHEVMNMTGDLRYVAAENFAEFADAGSEKRRADAWSQMEALRKRRARELGQPEPVLGPEARGAWMDAHPKGFLEHQEAFGPEGVYGRWLRKNAASLTAQRIGFLHGGLSPGFAVSLEEIDRRVHADLAAYDADRKLFVAQGLILPFFDFPETIGAVREALEALDASEAAARADAGRNGKTWAASAENAERRKVYQRFLDWGGWTMNAADGPLWFRGYTQWSDDEGDFEMPRLLDAARVDRLVVGHTVQNGGRIRVRFGGDAFLIDTGMLDGAFFPGGRASALEILDGIVTAIYKGEPRQVLWRPAPAKAAALR